MAVTLRAPNQIRPTTMSANQVLARYWPRGRLPVNPEAIASSVGITVRALDPSDPKNLNASGWYRPAKNGKSAVIEVDMKGPPVRRSFTIAHELGHHFLGHGERPRDTTKAFNLYNFDPIESEANQFAAELLMPADYVEALIKQKGITSLSRLISLFQVSGAAMEIRLKTLGYV